MTRRPKLEIVPPALIGTLPLKVKNGVLLVGSDPHWLPGQPQSTATRALIRLARLFSAQDELRGLVLNGDLFDFPAVSKHARIMWEARPTVADEILVGQERMGEIAQAVDPALPLVATIGNHDQRLEASLAQNAAACEGVPGFALRDHIDPRWTMAWLVEVNGPGPDGVLIRHRLKGGAGAGRSNVLAAGRSVVTGHTHQLNVTRVSNSLGDFWGVDTGTMSPIGSPAFAEYTEAAAASGMAGWASGLAVLPFVDGRMIWPELVHVVDEAAGIYSFRGQLHQTSEKGVAGRRNRRRAA